MAIGQLMDHRRHIAPKSRLAVLLPELPSDDPVIELCTKQRRVIFERNPRWT
jgi:hypothetical protein